MKRAIPLLALLLMGVVTASPPSAPMQFYGTVHGAVDGTVVEALVGGHVYTTTVENEAFGYSPELFFVEGNEGDEVNIYIGGTPYGTYEFQPGALVEIIIDKGELSYCGDGVCQEENCSLDCPPTEENAGTLANATKNVTEKNGDIEITFTATQAGFLVEIRKVKIPDRCPLLKNAYGYREVVVRGLYGSALLRWSVKKEWFVENRLDEKRVSILHCVDGEWVGLYTYLAEERNDVYVFEAPNVHFSVIALVAQPLPEEETPSATQPAEENAGNETSQKETSEQSQEPLSEPSSPETPSPLTGMATAGSSHPLAILLALLTFAAIIWWGRKVRV